MTTLCQDLFTAIYQNNYEECKNLLYLTPQSQSCLLLLHDPQSTQVPQSENLLQFLIRIDSDDTRSEIFKLIIHYASSLITLQTMQQLIDYKRAGYISILHRVCASATTSPSSSAAPTYPIVELLVDHLLQHNDNQLTQYYLAEGVPLQENRGLVTYAFEFADLELIQMLLQYQLDLFADNLELYSIMLHFGVAQQESGNYSAQAIASDRSRRLTIAHYLKGLIASHQALLDHRANQRDWKPESYQSQLTRSEITGLGDWLQAYPASELCYFPESFASDFLLYSADRSGRRICLGPSGLSHVVVESTLAIDLNVSSPRVELLASSPKLREYIANCHQYPLIQQFRLAIRLRGESDFYYHSNLVIIDNRMRTFERFEPNGTLGAEIDDIVNHFLITYYTAISAEAPSKHDDNLSLLDPTYHYIPSNTYCSNLNGLDILPPGCPSDSGYCAGISTLYAFLRVMNGLSHSREQIVAYIRDLIMQDKSVVRRFLSFSLLNTPGYYNKLVRSYDQYYGYDK